MQLHEFVQTIVRPCKAQYDVIPVGHGMIPVVCNMNNILPEVGNLLLSGNVRRCHNLFLGFLCSYIVFIILENNFNDFSCMTWTSFIVITCMCVSISGIE